MSDFFEFDSTPAPSGVDFTLPETMLRNPQMLAGKEPQGPVKIDWNHPFLQNAKNSGNELKLYMPLTRWSGGLELVRNQLFVRNVTSPPTYYDRLGNMLHPGVQTYMDGRYTQWSGSTFGTDYYFTTTGKDYTVLTCIRTGVGFVKDNNYEFFKLSNNAAGDNTNPSIMWRGDLSTDYIRVSYWGSYVDDYWAISTAQNYSYELSAAFCRTNNRCKLWKGRQWREDDSLNRSPTSRIGSEGGNQQIYIGQSGIQMAYMAVFEGNTNLSGDMMHSFHVDPYQFLVPA